MRQARDLEGLEKTNSRDTSRMARQWLGEHAFPRVVKTGHLKHIGNEEFELRHRHLRRSTSLKGAHSINSKPGVGEGLAYGPREEKHRTASPSGPGTKTGAQHTSVEGASDRPAWDTLPMGSDLIIIDANILFLKGGVEVGHQAGPAAITSAAAAVLVIGWVVVV